MFELSPGLSFAGAHTAGSLRLEFARDQRVAVSFASGQLGFAGLCWPSKPRVHEQRPGHNHTEGSSLERFHRVDGSNVEGPCSSSGKDKISEHLVIIVALPGVGPFAVSKRCSHREHLDEPRCDPMSSEAVFATVLSTEAANACCYEIMAEDMTEIVSAAKKAEDRQEKRRNAASSSSQRVKKAKADSKQKDEERIDDEMLVPAAVPVVEQAPAASSSSAASSSTAVVPASEEPSTAIVPVEVRAPAAGLRPVLRPHDGINYTLEEAKLLLPTGVGVSMQLNRGQGFTVKHLRRSTPGKKSHTCHWGGKHGYSQAGALHNVLTWIWQLHVAEGNSPPEFDLAGLLDH